MPDTTMSRYTMTIRELINVLEEEGRKRGDSTDTNIESVRTVCGLTSKPETQLLDHE